MRVSIVGAGYVGLVTGACLADWGHDVVLVDHDAARVEAISAGSNPIHEAGLSDLLTRNVGVRLRATADIHGAVTGSDMTLIAVGTPSSPDGIDLSGVLSAAQAVGAALGEKNGHHTVVVKSTVVPGTTDGVVTATVETASGRRAGEGLGVGMNPEFMTEGRAVRDFVTPDRLVLGASDPRTHDALLELYAPVSNTVPRLLTNTRTAEMIKYASNALLATMISFANEMANLCEEFGGVDVVDVMEGLHASDYLSPFGPDGERIRAPITAFLEAGCGFGGSCLPKDLRALIAEADRRGRPVPVLRAVLETNEQRADEMLRKLEAALGGVQGRSVTVLGVAFKPDTDDVRESPAIPIVHRLVARGACVTLHDPVVKEVPVALDSDAVVMQADLARAVEGSDAVVLVTRWDDYLELPAVLAGVAPAPVVLDCRRLLEPAALPNYVGIGRAL